MIQIYDVNGYASVVLDTVLDQGVSKFQTIDDDPSILYFKF